ncbi:hypothetical protein [Megasphaera cerevisiae]|uniref:hypothetical protein n=1 Tax=Megasphaera cerevisiae TaxID=39029 RepID=UPI0015C55AC9|nr:hypothetical protein [Megasphaera cerevisiae]
MKYEFVNTFLTKIHHHHAGAVSSDRHECCVAMPAVRSKPESYLISWFKLNV